MLKQFFAELKSNKFLVLFLFWLFFFIPIINFILVFHKLETGKHFLLIISTRIIFCFFVYKIVTHIRKITAAILLFFILIIYGFQELVKIGFLDIYGTSLIKRRTWCDLFTTNTREYTEFIKDHNSSALWLVLYSLIAIAVLFVAIKKNVSQKASLFKQSILFLGFISSIYFENKVVGDMLNGYSAFYLLKKDQAAFTKAIQEHQNKINSLDYKPKPNSILPNKIVVIIGESESKLNMSLYGYQINTTPKLLTRNDLLVLTNTITPYASTSFALNYVMDFGSYDNPDLRLNGPSIIDVYKSLNYKTKWITVQGIYADMEQFTGNGSLYLQFAKTCDTVIDLHKVADAFDEITFKPFENEIKKEEKQIIFIHLLGSHESYTNRYPVNFKKWNFNEKNSSCIENYNNSILYNDYVVDSLFSLSKKYKSDITCYFADHGDLPNGICENGFPGHHANYPNINTISIPLIFQKSSWISDSTISTFSQNKDKLYSTEDLIHTLCNLSNIEGQYIDERKSVFSLKYIETKRMAGDNITYDEIVKQPCGYFIKRK